jgi:hypothetical protein
MQGIYKITIGDKYYYGQAANLAKRRTTHLWALKNNIHHNPYMQNCFNKYMDFSFEIIEEIEDTSLVDAREQYYIDLHFDEVNCMNLARHSDVSGRGRIVSEETKAKIGAANGKQVQAILPDGTIKIWASAREAAEELNITNASVCKWAGQKAPQPGESYKHKTTNHLSGWKFSYLIKGGK